MHLKQDSSQEVAIFRCMFLCKFHPCFLCLEADEWILLHCTHAHWSCMNTLCTNLVILTDPWSIWSLKLLFFFQLCLYWKIHFHVFHLWAFLMIYLTVEEGHLVFCWVSKQSGLVYAKRWSFLKTYFSLLSHFWNYFKPFDPKIIYSSCM